MFEQQLPQNELEFLDDALNAGLKTATIRLREGEYQYDLAKAIASSQLRLTFPNVKDIVKNLYGEGRANDIQFIRKTQTILKKMEKSNIVVILPKKKPWELQRYALSSFRFQDIDKNVVVLAAEQETKQSQDLLRSVLTRQDDVIVERAVTNARLLVLALLTGVFYAVSVWALAEPIINAILFVSTFSVAVLCSLLLGRVLSKR